MINKKLLKKLKKEFFGKKVLIMGLGVHGGGVESARFFAELGAKVTVTDLKTRGELKESLKKLRNRDIKYVLGKHRANDFRQADLVIKNPGVKRNSLFLKIARVAGAEIENDVGVFFNFTPAKVIGVTGTKGKTTTANLIFAFIGRKPNDVRLAGVKQKGVLGELLTLGKRSIVVMEISNWQLEEMAHRKKSPSLAVLTNLLGDHLDTYKNIGEYVETKSNIFAHQTKKDAAIFNADDKRSVLLAKKAVGKTFFYSAIFPEQNGAWINGNFIVFGEKGKKITGLNSVKLAGRHNLSNVLAAVTAAVYLGVKPKNIEAVLKKFKGLPGKMEIIGKKNGILFINDTDATMPAAASEAVTAVGREHPVILIVGGTDKKLDFSPLIKAVKSAAVKAVVLLPGTATEKMKMKIKNAGKPVYKVSSMKKAVLKAVSCAEKGDAVLLSPGAASFGLFRNATERGEWFRREISNI